jgi:hypothetical protein
MERRPSAKGWPRLRLAVLVTALVAGIGTIGTGIDAGAGEAVPVTAHPVALDPADPARTSVGRLRYRGGLSLSSPDRRFGGLSGLLVDDDGNRFTAVTDAGAWIRGRLVYDGAGDLISVSDVTVEPQLDPRGVALPEGKLGDAEALTRVDAGIVVAFEHWHRLWLYDASGRPVPQTSPRELARAPTNGGIEALATLADGRVVALTESLGPDDHSVGWVRDSGNRWSMFRYGTDQGYRPTGAARLSDGDVLVLERRFPPLGVRLRRVPPSALQPGSTVAASEVATFAPDMTMDNMEGLDSRRGAGGRQFVYLVSDDNFSALQRTLLMMFELDQRPVD